ncbi:MAG: sigma-70 family RNA polymerase sigma factor [Gemmatimonadaceae bacterium]
MTDRDRRVFDEQFSQLFQEHVERLTRVIDRLSGEPDLAADLVQEAFVRLHRRGSLPDAPAAWVISVALNLFRNARSTGRRRARLLDMFVGSRVLTDPAPRADERLDSEETRAGVRRALDGLSAREAQLLLLRAEGYSYRDIADALGLNEASVGTLLARAKAGFRRSYEDGSHAS